MTEGDKQLKKFDFIGKDFYCNPMNFCRSFSARYFFWGGVANDERLRAKSSLMYLANSDMEIIEGYGIFIIYSKIT